MQSPPFRYSRSPGSGCKPRKKSPPATHPRLLPDHAAGTGDLSFRRSYWTLRLPAAIARPHVPRSEAAHPGHPGHPDHPGRPAARARPSPHPAPGREADEGGRPPARRCACAARSQACSLPGAGGAGRGVAALPGSPLLRSAPLGSPRSAALSSHHAAAGGRLPPGALPPAPPPRRR